VAEALAARRPVRQIDAPATIDGGDMLVVGRVIYVGRSSRTNEAAVAQVRAIVAEFGYAVQPVVVSGCLHLKSAVTRVAPRTLLLNPAWVDATRFADCDIVHVAPDEPHGANALAVGPAVVYAAAYPRTRERLERLGLVVHALDVSEIAKAEGAVTCCSLILG
jgi:dimethylargininase